MRVIEPNQFYSLKKRKKKKTRIFKLWLFFMISLILTTSALAIWSYNLPLPKVSAKVVTVNSPGQQVSLPWPKYGQASIGAEGFGLLDSTPHQSAVPTASIAKIITALAVLKAKPIGINQSGPIITLSSTDASYYGQYLAVNGTVVPVSTGEQITEYQALQAMLLPSANNMADSLAIWAFGSMNNYAAYANNLVKSYGLTNTIITSASGFPPQTISTADDLVKVGILAMNQPVIAQIVSQKSAVIPVAGLINNVNYMLGQNGIVGIKTGNTDQAGGCYLFAAVHKFDNGQSVTLIGSILGAPSLSTAMFDSVKLINASWLNFGNRTIVKQNDKLGYYDLPWGGQTTAMATKSVEVWGWKGSNMSAVVNLNDISVASKAGVVVGNVQNGSQSASVVLSSDVAVPNQSWRFKRWF